MRLSWTLRMWTKAIRNIKWYLNRIWSRLIVMRIVGGFMSKLLEYKWSWWKYDQRMIIHFNRLKLKYVSFLENFSNRKSSMYQNRQSNFEFSFDLKQNSLAFFKTALWFLNLLLPQWIDSAKVVRSWRLNTLISQKQFSY